MSHKHSSYQEAIFKAVSETNKNILIQAGPGASKSYTIIECTKRVSPVAKVLFIAFNKSIVEELTKKLPTRVKCQTLHALGNGLLYGKFKHLKMIESKTLIFANKHIKKWDIAKKDQDMYKYMICRIIELMRFNLVEDELSIDTLIDDYGLEFREKDYMKHILEVWKDLKYYNIQTNGIDEKNPKMIDFCDMIYLPNLLDITPTQYDVVCCDEVQDFNLAQIELAKRLIKPKTGRFIAVGDKCQSIYMFLGASAISFDEFGSMPNTISLRLPITYRCPISVISEINKVYDTVEPWENAKEGIVREGSWTEIKGDCFVLCRNNKPLIALYYQLIAVGVKCVFKNAQIIEPTLKFCESFVGMHPTVAGNYMKDKLRSIYNELKLEKGVKKPTKHKKFQQYAEKSKLAMYLADKFGSYEKTVIQLRAIMQQKEEVGKVVLATVHYSKGLESDRVFIIRPDLLGKSDKDMSESDLISEKNVKYVAVSRSKNELIYVTDFDDRVSDESLD